MGHCMRIKDNEPNTKAETDNLYRKRLISLWDINLPSPNTEDRPDRVSLPPLLQEHFIDRTYGTNYFVIVFLPTACP